MQTFDLTAHGSADLQAEVLSAIVIDHGKRGSLLDLCCGEMTVARRLMCSFHTGLCVDVQDCAIRPPDWPFLQADAIKLLKIMQNTVDVAFCGDGLEHFTKTQGAELLKLMLRRARLSIIFTPLGDYLVEPKSKNPDAHKSGWTPDDLPGWETLVFPHWHPTLNLGAFFAWKQTSQESVPPTTDGH